MPREPAERCHASPKPEPRWQCKPRSPRLRVRLVFPRQTTSSTDSIWRSYDQGLSIPKKCFSIPKSLSSNKPQLKKETIETQHPETRNPTRPGIPPETRNPTRAPVSQVSDLGLIDIHISQVGLGDHREFLISQDLFGHLNVVHHQRHHRTSMRPRQYGVGLNDIHLRL